MKIQVISFLGIAAAIGSAASALANGATASFPAGGVVFKHEKHISIEREDLDITLEKIHVHYVFRSNASHPLKLTIGFPMARYPLAFDGPDFLGARAAPTEDIHDYMAFKVKVNGKPLKPKLHQYAWLGDRNITLHLRKLHVPPLVFPATVGAKELQKLPKTTQNKLLKEKFVERYADDPTLYPQWDYQSVYEWRQSFKPGETDVDITYVPLTGDDTAEDKYSLYPGQGSDAEYCYDETLKKKFKALLDKKAYIEPLSLGYILKTAKNWNGPIGQLNLKVSSKNGYLFSFCPPAGLKPAGDGTHWVAKNFVPDRDLDVVFFYHSTE
jgi:hypothetical protein